MSLTSLLVALGWSAFAACAALAYRAVSAARSEGWPVFWLGALGVATGPMAAVALVAVFPGLPGVLGLDALGAMIAGWGRAAEPAAPVFIPAGAAVPVAEPAMWESLWALVSGDKPYLVPVLMIAYVAGLLFAGARLALGLLRASGIVRRARPAGLSAGLAEKSVFVTDETCVPFAWALPTGDERIILPSVLSDALPAERLAGIIAHERAHLDRRDPQIGLALSVLAVLFWFNPFVHHLIARWRLAAELACDARALDGASPATRKAYAQTLIDALRLPTAHGDTREGALPCPPLVPCAATFSTTKLKDEKMRLTRILKGSAAGAIGWREKTALAASAMLLGLAGCAGAATMSADQVAEAPKPHKIVWTENADADASQAPHKTVTREQVITLGSPEAQEVYVAFLGEGVASNADDWKQVITYENGEKVVRQWDDLSAEEKAEILAEVEKAEKEMANARIEIERAREEMDGARAEIEKARIEIRSEKGLSDAEKARIEEELERAKREIAEAKEEMAVEIVRIEREQVELREEIERREAADASAQETGQETGQE